MHDIIFVGHDVGGVEEEKVLLSWFTVGCASRISDRDLDIVSKETGFYQVVQWTGTVTVQGQEKGG